jgi:hypothetical protein
MVNNSKIIKQKSKCKSKDGPVTPTSLAQLLCSRMCMAMML